jgi:hypothetical protein
MSDYNNKYKYIIKITNAGFQGSTALLLRCKGLQHCTRYFFPTFLKKKNTLFYIQIFKSILGHITREIKATRSFEKSKSSYSTALRIQA